VSTVNRISNCETCDLAARPLFPLFRLRRLVLRSELSCVLARGRVAGAAGIYTPHGQEPTLESAPRMAIFLIAVRKASQRTLFHRRPPYLQPGPTRNTGGRRHGAHQLQAAGCRSLGRGQPQIAMALGPCRPMATGRAASWPGPREKRRARLMASRLTPRDRVHTHTPHTVKCASSHQHRLACSLALFTAHLAALRLLLVFAFAEGMHQKANNHQLDCCYARSTGPHHLISRRVERRDAVEDDVVS
jgi:hypothetical protein